jgi:predicted acetyltransferase
MTLYRGVGYGAAGGHYKLHISLKNLSLRERGLMVRPIESSAEGGGEGRAAVERLYRAHARTRAGWLERGPYVWHRVWRERDNIPVRGFSFVGDAGPEGYVLYTQQSRDDGDYDLAVRDLVSATPAAARRALGFLADHRSMAAEASWYGGPDDPHMYLLPERGYRMNLREHWMLRLTDVAEALAQRGYAPAVSARLDLEVTDSAIADNSGRFSLAVQDGVAEVRRGGRGSLALSVNALAGLYSGHLSAHQLAVAGAASGSARALATASAIFAGPPPTLPDFF